MRASTRSASSTIERTRSPAGVSESMAPTPCPAGMGALGHDEVAAGLDGVDGVADLAAHVDHQDVVVVTQLDHVARYTQTGDEDTAAVLDDLAHLTGHVAGRGGQEVDAEGLVG